MNTEGCPICESNKYASRDLCHCGYDFEKEEITDFNRIQGYYTSVKKDWLTQINCYLSGMSS